MVGSAPAIALYESAGWNVTDELLHQETDGITYVEHVLVKLLDDSDGTLM